jgi:hypothetical protein
MRHLREVKRNELMPRLVANNHAFDPQRGEPLICKCGLSIQNPVHQLRIVFPVPKVGMDDWDD